MLKLNTVGKNIQKSGKPLSATVVGVVVDITKPVHR